MQCLIASYEYFIGIPFIIVIWMRVCGTAQPYSRRDTTHFICLFNICVLFQFALMQSYTKKTSTIETYHNITLSCARI